MESPNRIVDSSVLLLILSVFASHVLQFCFREYTLRIALFS